MIVRRPAKRVSVKDVAARSGVSFQTTSKVLNGGGSVSEVTRARILQAASDLGYVPNLQARSLVTQRSQTVGLIAGDLGDGRIGRAIVGAEREARRHGYAVLITSVDSQASGTEYALPAMMERRVDGVLLAAPQMEGDLALAHVMDPAVPVVSLHRVPGTTVPTVAADDELIGYLATRHLLDRGHRMIGTLTGEAGTQTTERRLAGHRRALAEAGGAFDPGLVEPGAGDFAAGQAAAAALIARRPDLTALVAHSDAMAAGALAGLRAAGRRVPEDCSVVGCDDIDLAAHTAPPLTTVHVPFFEAGAEAMRLLLNVIAGVAPSPHSIVLPVRVVLRDSTAALD